jgi:GAF domain-containing protein
MPPKSDTGYSGFSGLLHGVVAEFQRLSGAEIVSLILYDEEARRYYAPVALGQPEDTLLDSIEDMQAQLGRYLDDAAHHKIPDELRVPDYGSTVWLTMTRQVLVARDAPSEIASTFVRRFQVESTVGLPLLTGERLMGLVYLNYCGPTAAEGRRVPDSEKLAHLERKASEVAAEIRAALAGAERSSLEGAARLAAQLTPAAPGGDGDTASLRRQLSIALAELLLAVDQDAALIYEYGADRTTLELLTAHAPAAGLPQVAVPDPERAKDELARAVGEAMKSAGLHRAAVLPLGNPQEPEGYMVVLSRDPLATVRRTPSADVLLATAASLIGGAMASRNLISTLAASNRLLGAVGRMSNAMLRPGSSRQDVLDAVAAHLTDAAVPEFDFDFATVYVVDQLSDSTMVVRMAAGATTSEVIESATKDVAGALGRRRVPRWALDQERVLAPTDVLTYVVNVWRTALVGSATGGRDVRGEDLIAGSIPGPVEWIQIPVVLGDGTTLTTVPAGLLGEAPPAGAPPAEGEPEPPFTLAGEVFQASAHADLIRLFVPFGLDTKRRATGVLEVGYHRSKERRPDWGQVEALRAAAAQAAIAVETARLYEEARRQTELLQLTADVSKALASSIELDQTLGLVARNLVRLVNASACLIALAEEDGGGWYGAAASEQEELWRQWHRERSEATSLFESLDRGQAVVVEDARTSDLLRQEYVELFGIRSLLALPLMADGQAIGMAFLTEREQTRSFTPEEVQLSQGLAHQAAVAIKHARLHALTQEERHIQKDFVLIGFGQWGQKAYKHLQLLKQFFNFRLHVVERDDPKAHDRLAGKEAEVTANGDVFYWDSPVSPAYDKLRRELESSCYVITYVATPAATHLPTVSRYYGLSDVILIEKPLGAPPEDYRHFLDTVPGGVELVAADHYYFKLEVRLLQQLLTEERTLRGFLDNVEEIQIEILEAQPLKGAAAEIGVVSDLMPHALAIISLFTPIERIELSPEAPLLVGRHEGLEGTRESYARLQGTFIYKGRTVRLQIDVGKGVEDEKWIKLVDERRQGGRGPFYKFDFARGEAIDGTQSTVRAAVRKIREPGVPDNAHLTMLRHVIEKQRPAVGILAIREAIRANVRIRELEALAGELLEAGQWMAYPLGSRPQFDGASPPAPRSAADGRTTQGVGVASRGEAERKATS